MPHLLGVDLGTSYFKVGLFNETGALLGLSRLPLRAESPVPGQFEVAVPLFWQLLREGVAGVLHQAGIRADQIAGLSYSSQANTFVLLDRADRPLTPLVLWTDKRGDPLPEALAEFTRTDAYGRRIGFTGMTGGWAPAKWRWFRENRREVWLEVRRMQTISDYFTFALTGQSVGDAGTASLLGLYDLTAGDWWPAALNAFEIDSAKLSQPLPPGKSCGVTSAAAAERIGLPAGIPFAVGSLDHHMAALGSGLGRLADVSISRRRRACRTFSRCPAATTARISARVSTVWPSIPKARASWRNTSGSTRRTSASNNSSPSRRRLRQRKPAQPSVRRRAAKRTAGRCVITSKRSPPRSEPSCGMPSRAHRCSAWSRRVGEPAANCGSRSKPTCWVCR